MHTTDPQISVAVMYHPSRTASARDVAASCAELGPRLVADPDPGGPPSPLRTAKRAWAAVDDGATHHLVLQDDVVLAKGFATHLRSLVRQRPDHAIALYVNGTSKRNGHEFRRAAAMGRRWAPVSRYEYTPTLSLVLPATHARGLAARLQGVPDEFGDDDEIVTEYCRERDVPVVSVVPSLVEHGDLPSVAGNDSHGFRRAVAFADDVDLAADHWSREDRGDVFWAGLPYAVQVNDSRCVLRFTQPASVEPVDTLFGWYWYDWCALLGVDARAVLDAWTAGSALPATDLEFFAAGYLLGFDVAQSSSTAPVFSPTLARSVESWLASGLSPQDAYKLDPAARQALARNCESGIHAGARAALSKPIGGGSDAGAPVPGVAHPDGPAGGGGAATGTASAPASERPAARDRPAADRLPALHAGGTVTAA